MDQVSAALPKNLRRIFVATLIQGPPSASAPAKKPETRIHKQFVPLNYQVGTRQQQVRFRINFIEILN